MEKMLLEVNSQLSMLKSCYAKTLAFDTNRGKGVSVASFLQDDFATFLSRFIKRKRLKNIPESYTFKQSKY